LESGNFCFQADRNRHFDSGSIHVFVVTPCWHFTLVFAAPLVTSVSIYSLPCTLTCDGVHVGLIVIPPADKVFISSMVCLAYWWERVSLLRVSIVAILSIQSSICALVRLGWCILIWFYSSASYTSAVSPKQQ
jgi:hypothetical protein